MSAARTGMRSPTTTPVSPVKPGSKAAAASKTAVDDNNGSGLDSRLIAYIPEGDHAAFKTAFYTVCLILFSLLLGTGVWIVYKLMYAFLKPMLWAILTGTVLFPVKQALTSTTKGWLRSLRTNSTPLVVGVVTLPISWLNACADVLWHVMSTHLVFYVIGSFVLIKLMIYERFFLSLIAVGTRVYGWVDAFLQMVANPVVIPFTVIYACVYVGWLYLQQEGKTSKKLARVMSLPVWLVLIVNVADYTGPLRVVVFATVSVTLALLAAGALAYENALGPNTGSAQPSPTSECEAMSHLGVMYLQIVFCCCAILFVARHTWLLALLSLPLAFAVFKQISDGTREVFGIKCDLGTKIRGWLSGEGADVSPTPEAHESNADDPDVPAAPAPKLSVVEHVKRLYDIMVPHTLRDFAKFIFYKDQNMVAGLEASMDLLSSVIVILALCVGMIFAAFFVVFQLHGEAVHLARLGGDVVNELKNGTWSAAVDFTDQQLQDVDVDAYIEQAFTQGRTYVAEQVRLLADPKDPERADMLEQQVMQIVDNLYQLWEQRQHQGIQLDTLEHDDIWAHLSKATDFAALKQELTLIVQENVDTILAVAQSVWGVLSGNLGFVTQVVAGFAGIILSFGMELLNAIIQLVVYFTMLYYLLVYSTDQFKPIEMLSRLTIKSTSDQDATNSPENSVSAAIEQSINGVFLLSAKMSVFYGLYTWFIHNLFGLNIVFLPSILALVLAAIPLTAPSWVCFIGMAELVVRGETSAAVLFFIASAAPMAFADSAFYYEVKGTHPYLTGLAIVGGMYWLGLQGAIIGPILLCCVLAMLHVYTNLLT